jgi:hypothetical protein
MQSGVEEETAPADTGGAPRPVPAFRMRSPDPSTNGLALPPATSAFGLALVRAAGGDARLLEALRRLAWEDYLAAGAPNGLDEAGMARWWDERRAVTGN